MHGLVALFLEEIVLAIIFLLIGLAALVVLVVATKMIMAPILLMRIVRSWIITNTTVSSMIAMLLATMLPVA